MHITLDQEQWEAGTGTTLGDVLADVSERAYKRSCVVTSLTVDQRIITDRDIDAMLLTESTTSFTQLTATSQAMQDIVHSAQRSVARYADIIRTEGNALVSNFRLGQQAVDKLDLWLGQLADYIEWAEGFCKATKPDETAPPLNSWVRELLDARDTRDTVRMADLLEYEILPRVAPK